MEKEYIIIYKGCDDNNKTSTKIQLGTKEKDEWNELRINALSIDKRPLSSITVGPKTVLEFYSDGNLTTDRHRVINQSDDKIKVYNFGCVEDHNLWRGNARSFIIMTFDYYNRVYGVRYCDSITQCKKNEMCLCPKGQEHPSWCRKTKRRCMNWSYFANEFPMRLSKQDMINTACLNEQTKKYGSDQDGQMTFGSLNEFGRKCALDKQKIEHYNTLEGFSYGQNDAWVATIILIVIFILILMAIKIVY